MTFMKHEGVYHNVQKNGIKMSLREKAKYG